MSARSIAAVLKAYYDSFTQADLKDIYFHYLPKGLADSYPAKEVRSHYDVAKVAAADRKDFPVSVFFLPIPGPGSAGKYTQYIQVTSGNVGVTIPAMPSKLVAKTRLSVKDKIEIVDPLASGDFKAVEGEAGLSRYWNVTDVANRAKQIHGCALAPGEVAADRTEARFDRQESPSRPDDSSGPAPVEKSPAASMANANSKTRPSFGEPLRPLRELLNPLK